MLPVDALQGLQSVSNITKHVPVPPPCTNIFPLAQMFSL